MKSMFYRFIADRSGATAIEYGLIATLIAVALIGGASVLGETINNVMDGAATHLKNSQ
ncbi:MAG: Flp family type IVb pilin [Hoeflea sp.]|uniref:Flp family type IVb pilin n=1 Tax=Hoeflea sp. TaxID=1940281 RepID=UPI003EF3A955